MNRYKKLMGNTLIFAIGTFSSKMLVFVMMRFYTGILTQTELGIADTINTAGNLLMPIASIGITNAVIRFGLEKANSKKAVFSIGLAIVLLGFVLMLPFAPLIGKIEYMGTYLTLIYLYVLSANLQSLCGQFVRARGHVRLYALDGVFRTLVTVLCNILFLAVFEWSITGYVLSVIVANALSAICLFFIDGLYEFVSIRAISPRLTRDMLKYAIPLITTTVCVWVFSMSDRFFILYMNGSDQSGLYSVAHRIPTLLVLVSGIFIEAWQISTINSSSKAEQVKFFSKVGNVYQSLVFLIASGLIMCSRLAIYLLAAPSYYIAWTFIPLLVFGAAFACLSNFQNSIYTLEKKSVASFVTALLGALMNLGLNFLLVPKYGPNGAALATLISYFAMFLARAIHSRRYLIVKWRVARFGGAFLLLCAQCVLMLRADPYWIVEQIIIFAIVALLGAQNIIVSVRKILKRS